MPEDFSLLPKTRAEAASIASKHYFTGRPCKRGHLDKRLVSTKGCQECRRERDRNPNRKRKDYLKNYDKSEIRKLAKQKYLKTASAKEKRRASERVRYYKDIDASRERARQKYTSMTKVQKEKANKRRAEYRMKNEHKKIEDSMRCFVSRVLRMCGKKKKLKTTEILGYSKSDLMQHIEAQFLKGMSWDNYGTIWEIDHITPVSKMISYGETNPAKINCLSNLRPLGVSENRQKKDKMEFLI